jgi:ACS family glucarate transporter-like MFS transporter
MHEAPVATAVGAAETRRTAVRWRVLGLICTAAFVAYLLRTNMSVAGEPMMRELGLTQVQLGIVLAAFAWSYAAFQFPGGAWAERIGSRRAITILSLCWGALNLLTALVPVRGAASVGASLAGLVVLRALMGAAQAPFFPATGGALTCNWFPVTGWAFPSSLGNAGLTLGAAATGPLIAWLMLRFGWRASFALTAPLAFVLAAVWWWYVRDAPSEHRGVGQAERALIDRDRPESLCQPPTPGSARRMLRDPQVLLLTASYFCSNYVFFFFFNWLFIYLVENRGMKLLESGFYASAPWITGAVGALIGGGLCDRLSKGIGKRLAHRRVALVSVAVSGVLLIAAAEAPAPLVAVSLFALCLGFQQASDAVYWSAAISVSGSHSSSACGVMNTAGSAVGGVVALLVPFTVRTLGWPAALGTGTAFAAVGAILWFWIRADREFPENRPA